LLSPVLRIKLLELGSNNTGRGSMDDPLEAFDVMVSFLHRPVYREIV
jgi:hypothetical protein